MAAYNADEIKRLAVLLAGNVKFKAEYSAIANKTRKVLLVEGGTDEKFINNIKIDTLVCINADKVFNSNAAFRTAPIKRVKSKESIAQLIVGVSKFPSPFIAYPEDIDKWDLYGMVDLDCDELNSGVRVPRLFVTDTHDLETLIISTDGNVFGRIEKCTISEADINKAFFVALQLSRIRELIGGYHDDEIFDTRVILCGSYQVDFSQFIYDDKINLVHLIKYIASNSKNPPATQKINQLSDKILKDKAVRKKFTTEGIWKQEFATFNQVANTDFWTSVNGHDILQLIRYYNEDACIAFQNDGATRLNRKFELAIIEKYNYDMIVSTELYKKMKTEGLVK